MVFSDKIRTDNKYSGYSEPIYSFLGRSALPIAERVRELIETWFSDYPEEERFQILPKLRSPDDDKLCSAFFELYIYELLHHLGLKVELHPPVNQEILRRPDFLVKDDIAEFYIEAVGTQERPDHEVKGQGLVNFALDKINEIQSEYFYANIDIEGIASRPIPSGALKREIQKWFGSLDYEKLWAIYQTTGLDGMPVKSFEYNGITLTISPILKNLNKGKPDSLIGTQMYGFRIVNTKEAIRKAIKRKSSRYGELDKPYIVAINVMSMTCGQEDVIDALFGSEEYTFNISDPEEKLQFHRLNDGAWRKSKGTRLSGVLISKSMTPWTVAYHNPTLYLNPWAKFPYNGRLRQLSHAQVRADGIMEWTEGIHPGNLFGLSESWPE